MKKPITGYAIFRSGFWLICPTEFLAFIENGESYKGIVKVEVKQIRKSQK